MSGMKEARLLSLLLLAATLACKAPTLEELERERPRLCNEAHPCVEGYACLAGVCQPVANGGECLVNAERECGQQRGECRKGVQTCGPDGRWGVCAGEVTAVAEVCNAKDDDCDGQTDEELRGSACGLTQGVCAGALQACVAGGLEQVCTGASYGVDYEGAETRCDSKDNDCDGLTDEEVTQPCEKQAGVCAGALALCSDGAFAACTTATYAAHSSAYEAVELTCDGQDNDCDGGVDSGAAYSLSDSATVSSGRVAAGTLRTTLNTVNLIALYEEDNKVVSRVFTRTGRGPVGSPSVTLSSALKAYGPVVASDETLLVAAWVEESDTGRYVMLSPLSQDGTSTIYEGKARVIFNIVPGTEPVRLSIALSGSFIAVAIEDPNATQNQVYLAIFEHSMAGGTSQLTQLFNWQQSVTDVHSIRPHVSPANSAGDFHLVWEVPGQGISLRTLKPDGSLSTTSPSLDGIGGRSASQPHVFSNFSGTSTPEAFVYFLVQADGQSVLQTQTCGSTTCSPGSDFPNVRASLIDDGLRLVAEAPGTLPRVALWAEVGTANRVRYSARDGSGGFVDGTLTPTGASGQWPAAVWMPFGSRRTLMTLFDTQGFTSGALPANEVLLQPVCLP